MNVDEIKKVDFEEALAAGKVKICTAEIDAAYLAEAVKFAWPGPRDVKVIYSPLHGVGAFAVMPLLAKAGFAKCEVYARHSEPSGDFPNVPGHVSNPENPAVFDEIIVYAQTGGGRYHSGHGSGLRSHGLCSAADDRHERAMGDAQRQSTRGDSHRFRLFANEAPGKTHGQVVCHQDARNH